MEASNIQITIVCKGLTEEEAVKVARFARDTAKGYSVKVSISTERTEIPLSYEEIQELLHTNANNIEWLMLQMHLIPGITRSLVLETYKIDWSTNGVISKLLAMPGDKVRGPAYHSGRIEEVGEEFHIISDNNQLFVRFDSMDELCDFLIKKDMDILRMPQDRPPLEESAEWRRMLEAQESKEEQSCTY